MMVSRYHFLEIFRPYSVDKIFVRITVCLVGQHLSSVPVCNVEHCRVWARQYIIIEAVHGPTIQPIFSLPIFVSSADTAVM